MALKRGFCREKKSAKRWDRTLLGHYLFRLSLSPFDFFLPLYYYQQSIHVWIQIPSSDDSNLRGKKKKKKLFFYIITTCQRLVQHQHSFVEAGLSHILLIKTGEVFLFHQLIHNSFLFVLPPSFPPSLTT